MLIKIHSRRIYAFAFLALSVVVCSSGPPEKAVPKEVFESLEAAIRKYYILNPEGQALDVVFQEGRGIQADFRENYKAALQGLVREILPNSGAYYKKRLFEALGTEPVALEKLRKPLERFVQALPLGESTILYSHPLRDFSKKQSHSIGVVLRKRSSVFWIVDVLEGSGAFRANLYPGLRIRSVDGVFLTDRSLSEVVSLIRGPKHSFVRLEFLNEKPKRVERGSFLYRPLQSSRWSIPGSRSLLYLMPRSLDTSTNARIRSLLQNEGKPDILVVDLRKLFSGTIQDAFLFADFFLPAGRKVMIKTRLGKTRVFESKAERLFTGRIYYITNSYISDLGRLVAYLLESRRASFGIGPDAPAGVFVETEVSLVSGMRLVLTNGAVYEPGGIPLYQKKLLPEQKLKTGFPRNPPLSAPDPSDPPQVFLARKLGLRMQ